MTAQSKQAFAESKEVRQTQKKIILKAFLMGFKGTNRELAQHAGLSYETCHKRTAELLQESKIIITGSVDVDGYQNSVYKLNNEPELFVCKKLTLRQWMKINHPEILQQHDNLCK